MPQPIHTKYTTRSTGVWELIRKWLVLVPNRSSGNPVVPLFRNPPPGARADSKQYKDPITLPRGDIVKNTYYARDHRRDYPQTSSLDQGKIAGLLSLGNKSMPDKGLLKGVEGEKQVTSFANGEVSLNEVLKQKQGGADFGPVVAPDLGFAVKGKKYVLVHGHGMYDDSYPVRMFNMR